MSSFRHEDFVAGTAYSVDTGDASVQFLLDKVHVAPADPAAFRLEFLGPGEPLLPQATYRFTQGEAEYDVFIVPVARDDTNVRYEAIFC